MVNSETLVILCTVGQTLISCVVMIVVLANKSQKREVSFLPELITRREYEEAKTARDKQINDIVHEMKENRDSTERTQSSRTAGLYKKVDEVRIEVKRDIDDMRRDVNGQVNELLAAVSEVRGELKKS